MMKNDNDFGLFINNEDKTPSFELDQKVLKNIQNKLTVSHSGVFIKLLVVQVFIGLITLTFCPQFSISLTNHMDMFHFFHRNFGELICTGICATIFMGSGAVFSTYIMSYKELCLINNNKTVYALSISGIFITIFLMINPEIYFVSAAIWIFSASMSFALVNFSGFNLRRIYYNI